MSKGFVCTVFVMFYKHKDYKNDPSKYRCIVLLNHEHKVLLTILLNRISRETDGHLSDLQTGFRSDPWASNFGSALDLEME